MPNWAFFLVRLFRRPGHRARLLCLAIEDVEALHRTHPEPELGRLLLWARRYVIAPWERKKS